MTGENGEMTSCRQSPKWPYRYSLPPRARHVAVIIIKGRRTFTDAEAKRSSHRSFIRSVFLIGRRPLFLSFYSFVAPLLLNAIRRRDGIVEEVGVESK